MENVIFKNIKLNDIWDADKLKKMLVFELKKVVNVLDKKMYANEINDIACFIEDIEMIAESIYLQDIADIFDEINAVCSDTFCLKQNQHNFKYVDFFKKSWLF